MSGTSRTRNRTAIPGTRVFRFGQICFWTERGLIVMKNEKLDEEQVIAPTDAKIRAASFYREAQSMLARPGKGGKDGKHYRDEAIDLLKMARALMECYKECKAFGDPFDPEVAEREAELQREIKIHLNTGSQNGPAIIRPGDVNYSMPVAPKTLTSFLGQA